MPTTTIALATAPELKQLMERTDQWLSSHDGLVGWTVVDLHNGFPVGYLWDSVEQVAGEWECTGKTEFHRLPDSTAAWSGDGIQLFVEQSDAAVDAQLINEMSDAERATIGLYGTAVVAYFSRLDED